MTEIYNATLYGHYVARYITTTYLHCKKLDIYPVLMVLIQHSYISLWYSGIYVFLTCRPLLQKPRIRPTILPWQHTSCSFRLYLHISMQVSLHASVPWYIIAIEAKNRMEMYTSISKDLTIVSLTYA